MDRDLALEIFSGAFSADHDRSGCGSRVSSSDYQGLSRKQIRQFSRKHVCNGQVTPVDGDVSQNWSAESLIQTVCRGIGFVVERDYLRVSAARFGHRFDQETVYRVADAVGKDARVGVLLHFADDLEVVANISVGEKTDDTQVILRIGGRESGADRFHHFGAAASMLSIQDRSRLTEVLGGGED